jgi:hypothetical protein
MNKTAGSNRMGQQQIQSDKCFMNPSVSKLFLETCGPLQSLDLTPLYFYLWFFERQCVNKQPTHTAEEPKQNIQLSISIVTEETLH